MRTPHAVWALKRLGLLLLAQGHYTDAISALHAALRVSPGDAITWEALGAAYQPLGRLTAAVKAYTRALDLDPVHVYALIQSGSLHLALGNASESLKCFECALAVDPEHPAALLGAADALTASATQYTQSAALKAASKKLHRALELAERCCRLHSGLVTAHKRVGDVCCALRLAVGGGGGGDGSTTAPQGKDDERIRVLQKARRAYAKSLFLNPSVASAWYDIAYTWYWHAHVLRLHPSSSTPPAPARPSLSFRTLLHRAQHFIRGALRLDPSSAEQWAALGACAADPGIKEYALTRSLNLDPHLSLSWVSLARLYASVGESGLAERCLQRGRSVDPAVGLIWEAMASLAALEHGSGGEKERAEYNKHAVGLGAGGEGLLGYAHASIMSLYDRRQKQSQPPAIGGPVYAAAYKAKELDACNPAAWNVWGLVSEARGDLNMAVDAYTTALGLITQQQQQQQQQDQESFYAHPATTQGGIPLLVGVELNLCRALVEKGEGKHAVERYQRLSADGVLSLPLPPPMSNENHKIECAVLSYSMAKAMTGDVKGAEKVVGPLLGEGGGGGHATVLVLAAAVELSMQLKVLQRQYHEAVQVLENSMQRLGAGNDSSLDACVEEGVVERLWMMAAAVAVVGRDLGLMQRVVHGANVHVEKQNAGFVAQLKWMEAMVVEGEGTKNKSASLPLRIKAFHLCPWSSELRTGLASALNDASFGGYASSVLSLLQQQQQLPATTAGPIYPYTPDTAPHTALKAATVALLDCGITAGIHRARNQYRAVARAIHARPTSSITWYVGALTALQMASIDQNVHSYKKAMSMATCAFSLVNEHDNDNDNSIDVARKKVRLLICLSEAQLRFVHHAPTRDSSTVARALESATAALQIAVATGDVALEGDACRHVARCHWAAGEYGAAQDFFTRAIIGHGHGHSDNNAEVSLGGAVAAMEWAQCLRDAGRGEEAAQVLTEEAERVKTWNREKEDVNTHRRHHDGERVNRRQQTGILQQILLQKTMVLASFGDLEASKAAAEEATPPHQSTAPTMRGIGLVAQGAVRLQQALTLGPDTERGGVLLAEARRALSEALLKGQDAVVPRTLLAQLEYNGGMRKKEERVVLHAEKALQAAGKPVPGALLEVLGSLQGDRSLCSKAVFVEPWHRGWWERLSSVKVQPREGV